MIDAGDQRAEDLAIGDHAADGGAAETGAMIAALAADEALARTFAADIVIAERDLQRGIDRFRAGVGEEHMVEIAGRHGGDARGERKGFRMAELKGRREIEFGRLLLESRRRSARGYGRHWRTRGRPCRREWRGPRRVIMHVLGASDHARALLESPIRRERHPIGVEIVRAGGERGGGSGHGKLRKEIGLLMKLNTCHLPQHDTLRRMRSCPRRRLVRLLSQ